MPHRWPDDTDYILWELDVLDRDCASCGRMMHVCDHRYRRFFTLEGPVKLVCKLNHCPDPDCPGHAKTKSPEMEPAIRCPRGPSGGMSSGRIGHRRFSRHWSIPQIAHELVDSYAIKLSEPCIGLYIQRYQTMLACAEQDFEAMRRQYEGVDDIILTIDGLQPEKGHETLYAVRELTQKRVWFAVPLISATEEEVRRLIAQAKQWAEKLGKRVVLWMSDKQDAFLKGIAVEFPGVPHRYCDNHFLRDVANSSLETDSHAKVQMRTKVRGLRGIEKSVLKQRRGMAEEESQASPQSSIVLETADTANVALAEEEPAGDVVLAYCAVVRGILNDDQGGPLHPPGLRMAEVLNEVRQSIQRNMDAKKGVRRKATQPLGRLHRQGLKFGRIRTECAPETGRGDPRSCRHAGPGKGTAPGVRPTFRS